MTNRTTENPTHQASDARELATVEVVEESLKTADDQSLASRTFLTPGPARGKVLLVPAMGVTQDFYAPLARWLAAEGYLTLSFDYRGAGHSLRGSLRGFQADLMDWARLDCPAALDRLSALEPDLPLYWLGHSLGGQLMGLVPGIERAAKAVTVATGSGYWRENVPQLRRKVWWLWWVMAPLAIKLCGYFPGRKLRKVGDLPAGVMQQWRRWCLDPEYSVGVEGPAVRASYAAVQMPIVSFSFTDDELLSARNIESMHSFYTAAPRTMRRLSPGALGLKRIGHFGFFRRQNLQPLWQQQLLPELQVAS